MISAVVFDLDDTLIDTACLSSFRQAKAWKACVPHYGRATVYGEVGTTLGELRAKGVKVGVVTASPSFYAGGIMKAHHIEVDALVAYHCTNRRKPFADPVLLCLQRLGVSPHQAVGVGDAVNDALAYRAAGITSLGAGWSAAMAAEAAWDRILASPSELLVL